MDLITTKELANRANIPLHACYKYIHAKLLLPVKKEGKSLYFIPKTVDFIIHYRQEKLNRKNYLRQLKEDERIKEKKEIKRIPWSLILLHRSTNHLISSENQNHSRIKNNYLSLKSLYQNTDPCLFNDHEHDLIKLWFIEHAHYTA